MSNGLVITPKAVSNKNEVLFRFKNQNDQDVCIQ